MENFKKDFQVLLITDPIQKLTSFFVYNDNGELSESPGYFIYYDKNKAMHEYMIDNKSSIFTAARKINEPKPMEDEPDEPEEKGKLSAGTVPLRAASSYNGRSRVGLSPRGSAIKQNDNRRVINMLTGLCAVMFLVSFIMGAGLLKSDDRISILEQNLSALNTAYRNLAYSNEQIASAFASGEAPIQGKALVVTENGNLLLEAENAKAAEAAFAPTPAENQSTAGSQASQPQAAAVLEVPDTYTVQQGDSLIGISQKFYATKEMVEKIMEANNIADPDKIFFGKILIMPKP